MLGLSLIRWSRRLRRDRGATASIVVVLLGGGVLFGATALSVDMGSLMWERRQLQNGADAVAQALAQVCASGAAGCSSSGAAAQAAINNANASDGRNGLDTAMYPNGVCGRNVPGLPNCNPSTGALWDCPPLKTGFDSLTPFVEAHTITLTGTGSSRVAPFFSGAAGNPGNTLRACARSAWGQPGAYNASVPLTFSYCEWDDFTRGGSNYQNEPMGAWPGYGGSGQPHWPATGQENTLYLQDHGTTSPCRFFGLHDVPGGFGWLNSGSGCMTIIATGNWAQVDTGISAPSGCSGLIASLRGRVIDLPIFDCMWNSGGMPTFTPTLNQVGCTSGTGSNTWDHIKGWARFYISGYKIGGSDQMPSLLNGRVPCSGGDRCISGWFVTGQINASTLAPPDPYSNFGTYAVLPAG